MKEQVEKYLSGNEAAALAVKQIGYDIMGYYPITPSTQIAENLDLMGAKGEVDITMIPAEGEHSAAGICYGASAAGARAFNATSANGLLYALEQFPVQSGTRYPMVMNVACRTVSGPLSIKGDHSDIMFMLNTGWIILFAHSVQQVYDFNIIATKLGESVSLPVVVAYDGFFTSHQKKRSYSFKSDEDVKNFVGKKKEKHDLLDLENPITIGSYMNEPDLINNRFQLYEAVTLAGKRLDEIFKSYENLSQRHYEMVEEYKVKDAEIVMILLGSAFDTVTVAVDKLRKEGIKAGVITLNVIRPFPIDEVVKRVKDKCKILVADRQDSYGANGGNLSLEVRAAFQRKKKNVEIKSVVYGLGGIDFDVSDGRWLLEQYDNLPDFSYYGVTKGGKEKVQGNLLKKIDKERTMLGITEVKNTGEGLMVKGGQINATTAMPDRIAPGHGACPGCGILVNLNLLLRAIEDPVVLLFQTGCGMIITTAYPKTSFRVPYIHNLFQNGAATMSGIVEACKRRQEKGEIPKGDIVFIMVTGDGGMDIGMGSALGTALRGHNMIIFEYDNGGYMNTGYQLSYSTPKGAKSATSHVGSLQYGKTFFNKDMPEIMAAANIPYVATVAECNPKDFITKAAKAAYYAKNQGMAYIKALSACPLNWNDNPATERAVIEAAVNCGYFPLYEVEKGITKLNYNHENSNKKMPVKQWFSMMGRTRHLVKEEYSSVVEEIQKEIDERFRKLKEKSVSINIKM
ncbi:thiamine pyrophosphate-dependent enzyme [Eubacterium sp. CAG:161]|uniref:thiamine pyrophosphate-dependent enzyme n=1 Tax=Eubacterium sp. CAG:161 TaxID=1262881 RepID=UPI0003368BA1|nr:thiamine pyrophosphate-dependent enzyme [Eubacterium sp. CAG:161]CCY70555.1 pyruvate ferredoxin oxidoreductase alpha subunit [Eubacterium sp. CAG:161]